MAWLEHGAEDSMFAIFSRAHLKRWLAQYIMLFVPG